MAERIKILMYPDYGDSLFWNERGSCIGGCKYLFIGEDGSEIEIDLSDIEGLLIQRLTRHERQVSRGGLSKSDIATSLRLRIAFV